MKRLAPFVLLLAACAAYARGGLTTDQAPSTPVPTLVQHVASSANPVGLGITGNAFKLPLPNAVGAGNALVLGITFPVGNTVSSITDTVGNSWSTTPAVTAAGSSYRTSAFVLPNSAAGAEVITVTFNASIIPFQYTVSEYNNVATSSPVNGSSSAANDAGASISAGAFTPTTNNDANGGNVIWSYFAIAAGASQNPSSFVPGSGMTLLDGDIAWNTNQGFPHASQWQLQATSASINPTVTATGDTNDFNAVALALKVASAGTPKPAGIHVDKFIHMTSNVPPSSSWTLQFPVGGNLRVMTCNSLVPVINITAVTDSEGGSWTKINPSSDEPQIWYRQNTTPNNALTVTLSISGSPATASPRFYDISGAQASSIGATAGKATTSVNGASLITGYPVITPQSSSSLIIVRGELGQGPGLGVTSPSGATWLLTTYSGEQDTDLMENADFEGISYNGNILQKSFDWIITAQGSNNADAVGAEFK